MPGNSPNNPARSIVAGRVGVAPLPGTISGRHAATTGELMGISASLTTSGGGLGTHRVLVRRSDRNDSPREAHCTVANGLFSDPDLLAASPQLRNHLAILQAATPRPRSRFILRCRICCSGISAAPLAVHDLDLRQAAIDVLTSTGCWPDELSQ